MEEHKKTLESMLTGHSTGNFEDQQIERNRSLFTSLVGAMVARPNDKLVLIAGEGHVETDILLQVLHNKNMIIIKPNTSLSRKLFPKRTSRKYLKKLMEKLDNLDDQ